MLLKTPHLNRTGMREWISNIDWGSDALALTLTFPHAIATKRPEMEKQLRHYWNVVDGAVFGNRSKYRKNLLRCQRFNFIEAGSNRDNYHCHSIVSIPRHRHANTCYKRLDSMRHLLTEIWRKKMIFNVIYPESSFKIEPINCLDQWGAYITKTITDKNSDALCLETSWLEENHTHTAILAA